MEHEVFVPVPAQRLREVLDDPARVARAVPGLQHDAGAEPVAGRLKVRVGSHSITYRGTLRVTGQDDGSYAVEGDAAETRGSGSVKLALRLRLRDADGGTTLSVDGTGSADGRITELAADAVASAVSRLIDRFAENLGAEAGEQDEGESPELLRTGDFEPRATSDFETTPDADDTPPPAATPPPAPSASSSEEPPESEPAAEPESPSVFETEVPPPSLDPALQDDDLEGAEDGVAEAAHARRTMIGRSAEEVDHAPPRGRYAPVPAPQTVSPPTSLRWAAPAAALAVASAVVAIRALRRRR
ncbi:SRPBCC domain-containing protein [Streptomyces sp. 15-116A]|uniref:SRPBCC domain-containing protein n=1 Tax=Streptomyces sp. 15-116A TaxID=2259035 RepID=UPI0021B3F5C0|nr:SRPBCC domain-containing protein [Streptomyces sp. 15-116A]MCT7354476.1 SRPBCC domain-containing protein [Streptomyces sp. 15-116A]